MKIASLITLLISLITNLHAEKNWIPMEPLNKTQTSKPTPKKVDINLSQIAPINAMMQKATLLKQLMDTTSKKEKAPTNDKNWFNLSTEDAKL